MTFLEIEAFLSIAQSGSFSSAAEKLYVTQPALGRRIRALEEELGYTLFVRGKGQRHVQLTRQGQAFIGLAHRWQALWNETREAALLGHEKNFYVASVGSLMAFVLPAVFQTFIREHPECSLHVSTLHSNEAYSYVSGKNADIAFITDPMYSSQVTTTMLFQEDLCLVAGTGMKFPEEVHLKDLDPRSEILTRWDRNFDAWHDYYFGAMTMPRVYLDEMGFLQFFTQSGDNWAFLPVSMARRMLKTAPISIHKLADAQLPKRTLYYLNRVGDSSPYETALLSLCREILSKEEGVRVTSEEIFERLTRPTDDEPGLSEAALDKEQIDLGTI